MVSALKDITTQPTGGEQDSPLESEKKILVALITYESCEFTDYYYLV